MAFEFVVVVVVVILSVEVAFFVVACCVVVGLQMPVLTKDIMQKPSFNRKVEFSKNTFQILFLLNFFISVGIYY